MENNFSILIPARIGSTRLLNKPLIDLYGKSLIQRVYEQARTISDDVYIATDSDLVLNHVISFTDNVVITSDKHISGTDRVYEAVKKLAIPKNKLIINLQGDEPFMPTELIQQIVSDYDSNNCDVITASHNISSIEDLLNQNCVKVETNKKGWKWEGNAYLDGNFGTRALEQDFSYWTWSRLPFANHTTTFYDAELKNRTTTNIALKFSKDGSATTLEPPPLKKVKRTKWFLKRVARSDQDFDPLQNKPLLDAPFYSRSELLTKINGEKTIGIHEALDMNRFTNPFIQPLLCVKIPRSF